MAIAGGAVGCVVDTTSTSTSTRRGVECRNSEAAAHLKLVSIFVILVTSVVGITLPVVLARYFKGKPSYDKSILIIKCFAAGVILSTSLVHVLPDAYDALSDCQVASTHPWGDFPFAGLVTLIGVLLALLVDLTATAHVHVDDNNNSKESYLFLVDHLNVDKKEGIDPDHQHHGLLGKLESGGNEMTNVINYKDREEVEEHERDELLFAIKQKQKQKLVSQVLEIGIIFHSVIIGATMGMSQNECTIRPLVAAIAFHQIFEGLGLGGCIAQAGFSIGTVGYMSLMFAVTTPMGIVLGMMVFGLTGYDDTNPNSLVMEGLLGALSSGILIYMALVDLIALDFFHNNLMANSHSSFKKAAFFVLALGSTSMSILALWA